ncbi:MAG: NTP/NDP exchange transporter [Vicinamibacterales bacterium]
MADTTPFPQRPTKSVLERVLSFVTDVRPGEGITALLLTANLFSFFALYYILRPVRQALILSESGAVAQSYSAAAQAMLLLVIVPLYGSFASRVSRMRLITVVICFFSSNLVAFYLLGNAGARLGVAFYIWLGIFNLMIPAQLWAFANDVYVNERGKRLFPLVGLGASLGALVGSLVASAIFGALGPYALMLIAAASLFVCLGLTVAVNRREGVAVTQGSRADAAEKPLGPEGGFQLILAQRYLLYIALLMVVLNLVNTIGEFLLGSYVERTANALIAAGGPGAPTDAGEWIGEFYSDFYFYVNLFGLVVQSFFVSRIIKYLGVRGALFVLPLIALASYGAMTFFPVLTIVRWAKTLENGMDYSLNNTVRHALFLPTSREAKYKAKQAIDAFFWRMGDLLQAVVVFFGTRAGWEVGQFAALNMAFVVIWLGIAVGIAHEHRKLTADEPEEQAA